jgi:RecA-family ATPase
MILKVEVTNTDIEDKIRENLLSSAQFNAQWKPPEYLLDGILQKHYLYALTAPTGVGKTTWLLLLAALVALGLPMGKHKIKQGNVCYFAGENPDDVLGRWRALSGVRSIRSRIARWAPQAVRLRIRLAIHRNNARNPAAR